jgi:hypothetical protein
MKGVTRASAEPIGNLHQDNAGRHRDEKPRGHDSHDGGGNERPCA